MTDHAESDDQPVDETADRGMFDGAGWFLLILTLALVYGLGVSAFTELDGEATPGAAHRDPPTAVVAQGP